MQVTTLQPTNAQAFEKQGLAFWKVGRIAAAIKSCRRAEILLDTKSNSHTSVLQLMDDIAISAGLEGKLEGFDGRQLQASSTAFLVNGK